MTKRKNLLALLLAAVVCFGMVVSLSFLAAEADHHCTGEDCWVCEQLQLCETHLRTLPAAPSAATLAAVCLACFALAFFPRDPREETTTLVSLRVKLSN